jgi:hypothetical protein
MEDEDDHFILATCFELIQKYIIIWIYVPAMITVSNQISIMNCKMWLHMYKIRNTVDFPSYLRYVTLGFTLMTKHCSIGLVFNIPSVQWSFCSMVPVFSDPGVQ